MFEFILEALEVPPPGWRGRRRYIARQLWKLAVEGLTFVLVLAALFGAVIVTYFAMNGPVPS